VTGGTLWPCLGDTHGLELPPIHGAACGFLYSKVSIDSLDYLSFVIRRSICRAAHRHCIVLKGR